MIVKGTDDLNRGADDLRCGVWVNNQHYDANPSGTDIGPPQGPPLADVVYCAELMEWIGSTFHGPPPRHSIVFPARDCATAHLILIWIEFPSGSTVLFLLPMILQRQRHVVAFFLNDTSATPCHTEYHLYCIRAGPLFRTHLRNGARLIAAPDSGLSGLCL
jgi:hypothetical protein